MKGDKAPVKKDKKKRHKVDAKGGIDKSKKKQKKQAEQKKKVKTGQKKSSEKSNNRRDVIVERLNNFLEDSDTIPSSYQFKCAGQWYLYCQLKKEFGSIQAAAKVR